MHVHRVDQCLQPNCRGCYYPPPLKQNAQDHSHILYILTPSCDNSLGEYGLRRDNMRVLV